MRGDRTNHSMAEEEDNPVSFSFAGCGFLGIYHIGVVACLREHAPHLIDQARFAGASAGSVISACVICNIPLNEMADFVFRLARSAGKHPLGGWEPYVEIEQMLRQTLETVLPENAHELCSDRLFVSTTRVCDIQTFTFSLKNEIISKYKSKSDLIDVLMCSAFVPFFSAYRLPEYNGNYMIDGGLTDNIPKLDKDTITVCPLFGEHSICPRDEVGHSIPVTIFNMSCNISHANAVRLQNAFYAPSYRELLNYCWQGYDNALTYLMENGLIHCRHHRAVLAHLRYLQSCGRDCRDCLHNRDHARHARLNEEALGQNNPAPEKLNPPSHYVSGIIGSAVSTTVLSSMGAAMWLTKKSVSTFSHLFFYVLRKVREVIQELFCVAYLAPSKLNEMWTGELDLLKSIFSIFKQWSSLQAWTSWAYEVSLRFLLKQLLFWSRPTGMLLSKVMHIAQQFKALFFSVDVHYLEPCRKCLRSLKKAPGIIISKAEDVCLEMGKNFTRNLKLIYSLIDTRVVNLEELSKRAVQLLAQAEDICFQTTVFVFGRNGSRCLRRLQRFFLAKGGRIATVVSDYDFTHGLSQRVQFYISDAEKGEMDDDEDVHEFHRRHFPRDFQTGSFDAWRQEEVVVVGSEEEKDGDDTNHGVDHLQPTTRTPSFESEEVYPIFALGDVDFADLDDLNQMRLALGVGMSASQASLATEGLDAGDAPVSSISSRGHLAGSYRTQTAPGKVRQAEGTQLFANDMEELHTAIGDATFDQMTEEEQMRAAAAMAKDEDYNLSFSMKIQVERKKMVVPAEEVEDTMDGAAGAQDMAVPTLAAVEDFCFKESSQRREAGEDAEADDEMDEEEDRKRKERVHEYIHRFEGYHPVMTIHYTDETGKQHSQSLFVNEGSSSDEEQGSQSKGKKRKKEEETGEGGREEEHSMRQEVKRLLDNKLFKTERSFERKNQIRRKLRGQEQMALTEEGETSHAIYDLHVVSFMNENPVVAPSCSGSRPTSRPVSRPVSRPLSRQPSPSGSNNSLSNMSAMVRSVSDACRLTSSLQRIRAQRDREERDKNIADSSCQSSLASRESSAKMLENVATQPSTPTLPRSSCHLERSSSDTSQVKAGLQSLVGSFIHRSVSGERCRKKEDPDTGLESDVTSPHQQDQHYGAKKRKELNSFKTEAPDMKSLLPCSGPYSSMDHCSFDTGSTSLSHSQCSQPAVADFPILLSDSDSGDETFRVKRKRRPSSASLHKGTQTNPRSPGNSDSQLLHVQDQYGSRSDVLPQAEAPGSEDEGISSADALNSPFKDEDDSDCTLTPEVAGKGQTRVAPEKDGVAGGEGGAAQAPPALSRSRSVRSSLLELSSLLSDLRDLKAAKDKSDNESQACEEDTSCDNTL